MPQEITHGKPKSRAKVSKNIPKEPSLSDEEIVHAPSSMDRSKCKKQPLTSKAKNKFISLTLGDMDDSGMDSPAMRDSSSEAAKNNRKVRS